MEHFYHKVQGHIATIDELYKTVVPQLKDGAVCVELGVFGGQSFACLAVEAINTGRRIDLYGVDLWDLGGELHRFDNGDGQHMYKSLPITDCLRNLAPLGDWNAFDRDMYTCSNGMTHMTLRRDYSHVPLLEKASCDLVFVDADHTYDSCKKDIRAWRDRVKPGGILAGHDYTAEYPGVMRAANELLGERNLEHIGICWVWRAP